MDFLEKDLEEILHSANQKDIQTRGLWDFEYTRIFRQVELGNYGRADLITFLRNRKYAHKVTVYELKNLTVDAAAYWQLVRYMKAVKTFLISWGCHNNVQVSGVLIGRKVDTKSDVCYIPDVNPSVNIFTYDYHLGGMYFQEASDYNLTDKGYFSFDSLGYDNKMDMLRSLTGIEGEESAPF